MIRRGRLIAILVILATGAIGTISSTQTWLTVSLGDGPHDALAVPGASAIPVLAPLSLAVLALGGALTIVGRVLRYVFGALTLLIAGSLAVLTGTVLFAPQPSHVASVVTETTGITGHAAVAELVSSIHTTPWPAVTLVGWIVLAAAGVLTLLTGHSWGATGRRYSTDDGGAANAGGARPHDAIDDWDDLSRGQDPTA